MTITITITMNLTLLPTPYSLPLTMTTTLTRAATLLVTPIHSPTNQRQPHSHRCRSALPPVLAAGLVTGGVVAGMGAFALSRPQGSLLKWGGPLFVGLLGLIGCSIYPLIPSPTAP